jgi:hypothetical protein
MTILFGGVPVSIHYPAGPQTDMIQRLCSDYFKRCEPTTLPARCHIAVQRNQDKWAVFVNGQSFMPLQHEEQLGLGLMHAARALLYHQAKYDIAFHAATVAQGEHGLLLCAPRESGKSTLAAYLFSQGFDLLTDEPALFHSDSWSITSLRVPVSLKEGSWSLLEKHWEQLANAPIHSRSDGMRIKLAHPGQPRHSQPPRRVTQIIFPRYSPGSAGCAERQSPLDTLRLLDQGGMTLARRCSRSDFESFLQFVCRTPALVLTYSSLEDAHKALQECMPTNDSAKATEPQCTTPDYAAKATKEPNRKGSALSQPRD